MYGSYTYNFGFGRPGFGFGHPGYRYPGFRFWPSNHIEPSAPPICPPPYPGTDAELQSEFHQPPFIISEFSSERIATGPFPVRTECPLCKQEVLTETYSSAGLLAWLLGGGLCLIGCSLGCCLIPCCIDACRDVVHKCPSCKQQIALFKRL